MSLVLTLTRMLVLISRFSAIVNIRVTSSALIPATMTSPPRFVPNEYVFASDLVDHAVFYLDDCKGFLVRLRFESQLPKPIQRVARYIAKDYPLVRQESDIYQHDPLHEINLSNADRHVVCQPYKSCICLINRQPPTSIQKINLSIAP